MDYLLDTNIVLIYLRESLIKDQIEKKLDLFSPNNSLLISLVSVGELESIAIQNNWGDRKKAHLSTILNRLLVADINARNIILKYAEVDAYSQDKLPHQPLGATARNMGKNDLWIAATASELNIPLVTTDKDFQHLKGSFLDLVLVDLKEFKLK